MDDGVGAEIERKLEIRRRERVVDDDGCADERFSSNSSAGTYVNL